MISPICTKDPCNTSPCGKGSTCQSRGDQEFVCLCLAGEYYNYNWKSCISGKSSLAATNTCFNIKRFFVLLFSTTIFPQSFYAL